MTSYREAADAFFRWIDRVAATIVEIRECFRPRRRVRLVEQQDGTFVLHDASHGEASAQPGITVRITDGRIVSANPAEVTELLRDSKAELVLQPKRFVVRLLELPRRASEFLDGIVRAQIDRLTPWSAAHAAFGWHPSATADAGDRMAVTIAATARKVIEPLMKAVADQGAGFIIVSAALQEPLPDTGTIKVCEQNIGQAAALRKVRRFLTGLAAIASLLALASLGASVFAGGAIEAQRDDINSRIAELRAKLQPGRDSASEAVIELERRKHETPSSVIVIETLSRILPDDTYLTELRVTGNKVQMIGMTRDAPSLIRLIEQTPHFRKATFFAPTTRTPADSLEHFSIEAQIQPVYTPVL